LFSSNNNKKKTPPTGKGQTFESPLPSLEPTEASSSSVSEEEEESDITHHQQKKEKSTGKHPKRSKNKKSKKGNNCRTTSSSSSRLLADASREDLEQMIEKLQSTQEKMELHQAELAKEHRFLQRYIDSMRRSKQKTERRNKELETQLFKLRKEHEEQSYKRTLSSSRHKDFLLSKEDLDAERLAIENQVLRKKLMQCKQSLLEANEQIGILGGEDDDDWRLESAIVGV